MQLNEAVQLFLGEYKPSTQKSYKYCLRDIMRYLSPERPLHTIEAVDLVRYSQLIKEKTNPLTGELVTPATYNKYLKTLRTFFNWCVKMGLIGESPAGAMRREKLSKMVPREKAMPEPKFARLLDYWSAHPREEALIRFLADTGCRIGGAAGVRVSDLDLKNLKAYVTEKGATEPRPVWYGVECRRALSQWLLENPRPADAYVFSSKGDRITNDSLGQFFRRLCERARIGSYGPHSLRHRKGHQFADRRTPPSIAAQALGHSDVNITLTNYYPADWERVERELAQLNSDNIARQKTIDFPDTGT